MFEYIGGETSYKIFELMPSGSEMLIIGCLSDEPLPLSAKHILYNSKTVRAFTCPGWVSKLTYDEKRKYKNLIADDYNNGGHIYGTKIAKIYPLD
jgi:hypothetical protein